MSCDVKKGQACHLCSLCEFSKSLLYFHPPCSDANLVYVARHCGQLKQTRERKPFTVRFCNSLVLTPFDYDFPEVTSPSWKKTSRSKLSLSNSLENHKSQRTTKYLTTNLTFFVFSYSLCLLITLALFPMTGMTRTLKLKNVPDL